MELFPPINDLLQLAPLPTTIPRFEDSTGICHDTINAFTSSLGFKSMLCLFMVVDTVVAYLLESSLVKFFELRNLLVNLLFVLMRLLPLLPPPSLPSAPMATTAPSAERASVC